jgi:hypothetical protein
MPQAEVELPRTIVVIGSDFICGCKYKYHMVIFQGILISSTKQIDHIGLREMF